MTSLKKHAASYVAEPLVLQNSEDIAWAKETEVLVVGYGAAGAAAALEARGKGADVLVVERFEGGGATCLSGGIIYAGGTPYQKAAGIEDSTEEMFRYLKMEIGDGVKEETLRHFCESSTKGLQWLSEHGVEFGSNAFTGKRSYPPKGFDLYYSGNEAAPDFAAQAKPAQRGHRVKGEGYTGKDLFAALRRSAESKGVRVSTQTMATRLVVDENRVVLGVEVSQIPHGTQASEKHLKLIRGVNKFKRLVEKLALKAAEEVRQVEQSAGQKFFIRASKGVILTTGSFAFNREMVRHYAPKYSDAMPLGTLGCDGSGILLGMSAGGAVDHLDSVSAWRSISPPDSFVKCPAVNLEGKRFIAEDAYLGHLGRAIANQTGQRAWLILDSSTYWNAYRETWPQKGEEGYLEFRGPLLLNLLFNSTRGKTLSALAAKIGVPADQLEATVAEYNQQALAGQDDFHKKPANFHAITKGSFYAIDISVGSKKYPCPTIPMGGLQVDEESSEVLDEAGQPITGLYAAGRAAVGIPSAFYVSGTSLSDCIYSGRRAGRHAATSLTANNLKQVESL